jgi:hypothetical protein
MRSVREGEKGMQRVTQQSGHPEETPTDDCDLLVVVVVVVLSICAKMARGSEESSSRQLIHRSSLPGASWPLSHLLSVKVNNVHMRQLVILPSSSSTGPVGIQ